MDDMRHGPHQLHVPALRADLLRGHNDYRKSLPSCKNHFLLDILGSSNFLEGMMPLASVAASRC